MYGKDAKIEDVIYSTSDEPFRQLRWYIASINKTKYCFITGDIFAVYPMFAIVYI